MYLGSRLRPQDYLLVRKFSVPLWALGVFSAETRLLLNEFPAVVPLLRGSRNSALSLLSVMTVLHPAAMASCLSEMLTTVGDIAVAERSRGMVSGGQVALRQTQRVVQSMIPSLRAHGSSVGIGAHRVVKVRCLARRDVGTREGVCQRAVLNCAAA